MKIENVEVYGFRSALRGMRNPMNSWDKSDSTFEQGMANLEIYGYYVDLLEKQNILVPELPIIGPNDLKLACKLIKGGSEHRKFLRQIQIWMDITIPRYIWQELDTYKICTVRNSCSTMHKLGSRDLEESDFELPPLPEVLQYLNRFGKYHREAKAAKDVKETNRYLRELKAQLPESFLQKATYSFNYETALTMYFQRRNHRLPEWNERNEGSICHFLLQLPYMKDFIMAAERKKNG